jgi:glyceraldehyde-3-phosphate dehydrogenase (NADP+)
MKMLLAGEWVERKKKIEVKNPFNGKIIDTVPRGTLEDIDRAVQSAKIGLDEIGNLSSYERYEILLQTATLIKNRKDKLAKTIALESGKKISEARTEVDRAVQTFTLSAEEAKRIYGETIPFDSVPYGKKKYGFYIRVPVGIIAAISPFNFPLNLVAHKIAPGIAAANAIILKPSSLTPLIALMLGEILLEAGLPKNVINIITGPGEAIGDTLVSHESIRMVTFTGSLAVAQQISKLAGFKKVLIEAGSNSACVVMGDADLEKAATRIVAGAFALAGQVCISVQRVFVDNSVFDKFLDILVPKVETLKVGDQLSDKTDVGPMISESAAARAKEWLMEAESKGAKVLVGGKVQGTLFEPTVLTSVPRDAKIYREEAFAPVVIVEKFNNMEEAIELVNDTKYGLQAGIFTNDLGKARQAIEKFDVGGIIIGDVPTFRADPMPYGGMKFSGLGREGPKFAVQEMTEIKAVCFEK